VFEAEGRAAKWCKAISRLQRRANGEDDFTEEEWTQNSLDAVPTVTEGRVEVLSAEDAHPGDEREMADRRTNRLEKEKKEQREKYREGSDSGSEGSSGRGGRLQRDEKRRSKQGKKDNKEADSEG
jgi:hypothetical protein